MPDLTRRRHGHRKKTLRQIDKSCRTVADQRQVRYRHCGQAGWHSDAVDTRPQAEQVRVRRRSEPGFLSIASPVPAYKRASADSPGPGRAQCNKTVLSLYARLCARQCAQKRPAPSRVSFGTRVVLASGKILRA